MDQSNKLDESNQASRFVLGTAQLGMNYGIANKSGTPDSDLAKQIVKSAWENGIREYDTAQGYGESENVLGKALHSLGFSSYARVITKLDPGLDHLDRSGLEQAVKESLDRLNVPILHSLMLHKEEYLELWEKGLGRILRNFVERGLTRYLGVSVYSPDSALLAHKTDGIDMLQIPSNILDRRFEKAGIFQLAENNGKQIYVRSVFLQGLLLMDSEEVPPGLQFAVEVLEKLRYFSHEIGLSRQDLALGYVRQAYPQAKVVFGVETLVQIKDNLKSWEGLFPLGLVDLARKKFNNLENRILNPALWQK